MDSKFSNGGTPLHEAASTNFLNFARLLIDSGADIEAKVTDWTEHTVLQLALNIYDADDALDMASLLIDSGADIEAKGLDGMTPLQYAGVGADHIDIARLLIEQGANTDGIDLSWMN
jgi:ankyrin repeat protein